jgi:hypothetical protein
MPPAALNIFTDNITPCVYIQLNAVITSVYTTQNIQSISWRYNRVRLCVCVCVYYLRSHSEILLLFIFECLQSLHLGMSQLVPKDFLGLLHRHEERHHFIYSNCESSAGTVIRPRNGLPRDQRSILRSGKRFFSSQEPDSGAHAASYSMGTRGLFPTA